MALALCFAEFCAAVPHALCLPGRFANRDACPAAGREDAETGRAAGRGDEETAREAGRGDVDGDEAWTWSVQPPPWGAPRETRAEARAKWRTSGPGKEALLPSIPAANIGEVEGTPALHETVPFGDGGWLPCDLWDAVLAEMTLGATTAGRDCDRGVPCEAAAPLLTTTALAVEREGWLDGCILRVGVATVLLLLLSSFPASGVGVTVPGVGVLTILELRREGELLAAGT